MGFLLNFVFVLVFLFLFVFLLSNETCAMLKLPWLQSIPVYLLVDKQVMIFYQNASILDNVIFIFLNNQLHKQQISKFIYLM